MRAKGTTRNIIFYELHPELINKSDTFQNAFKKIAEELRNNIKSKTTNSFIKHGGNEYLIDICLVDEDSNRTIKGVIRSFTAISPEIFHKRFYSTRDIEKEEDEDIVFSTHFVIRAIQNTVDLAIETSKEGPGYQSLIYYLETIGKRLNILENISPIPHTKDSLKEIQEKFGRCSEFIVKVHKSNISKIAEIDKSFFESMDVLRKSYQQDYVTISLKYDYKDKANTNSIWNSILKFRRYLLADENNKYTFERIEASGEEKTRNLKLEVFNLLSDHLKVKVPAELRPNSKGIVYHTFLAEIAIALNNTIN